MSDQQFDLDQVRAVIKIASESPDVAELAVESPALKVTVRKVQGAARATVSHAPGGAPASGPVPSAPTPTAGVEGLGIVGGLVPGADHMTPVTAPMVGTFYRAPNPDAPPFVSEGDVVEAGQTVCIIEAMKLFNEIQSDVAGRVSKILVDNATPVEYGQPLILIDTSGEGA